MVRTLADWLGSAMKPLWNLENEIISVPGSGFLRHEKTHFRVEVGVASDCSGRQFIPLPLKFVRPVPAVAYDRCPSGRRTAGAEREALAFMAGKTFGGYTGYNGGSGERIKG